MTSINNTPFKIRERLDKKLSHTSLRVQTSSETDTIIDENVFKPRESSPLTISQIYNMEYDINNPVSLNYIVESAAVNFAGTAISSNIKPATSSKYLDLAGSAQHTFDFNYRSMSDDYRFIYSAPGGRTYMIIVKPNDTLIIIPNLFKIYFPKFIVG